jgi:soluble lytic murein transglycosylase-like protein
MVKSSLLAVVVVGIAWTQNVPTTEIPEKYFAELIEVCTAYDVPVQYMARLVWWESRWNETAIMENANGTRDVGLCGLNSASACDFSRWYNDGEPYDPLTWRDNLRIGAAHIRAMHDATGSWVWAVMAYNMGLRGWRLWRAGERTLLESTIKLVEAVFG